ncbi:MAG: hypothetical protein ACK559_14425, partial [bacterium]
VAQRHGLPEAHALHPQLRHGTPEVDVQGLDGAVHHPAAHTGPALHGARLHPKLDPGVGQDRAGARRRRAVGRPGQRDGSAPGDGEAPAAHGHEARPGKAKAGARGPQAGPGAVRQREAKRPALDGNGPAQREG